MQFRPTAPLVDQNGVLLKDSGKPFLLTIYNRTGGASGVVPSQSQPIIASGSSIADAFGLSNDWNDVETVAPGTGVAIAAALNLQPGNDIWVFNGGANNLNVYPPSALIVIDALAAGNAFVLAPGKLRCFQCWQTKDGASITFRSYGN
jgi:hypothetical protein